MRRTMVDEAKNVWKDRAKSGKGPNYLNVRLVQVKVYSDKLEPILTYFKLKQMFITLCVIVY